MKKNLYYLITTYVLAFGLFAGSASGQCLQWQNPTTTTGWTDFNTAFGGAPCDDGTGCPFNEIQDFQVFAAEAYSVDNFKEGGKYAFSMCNGAGAGTWVPEFTIIAPDGTVDAFGPGDGDGCTITWTASQSGTYLIVINEAGQCGGGPNTQTDNGFPALTCIENASCVQEPCEAGGLSTTDPVQVCGLDATFSIATDGTEAIPSIGGHGWNFSDELGGTGGIPGGFTLTDAPTSDDYNSDLNGVLSANALPRLEGTWVVRTLTYANANTPTQTVCGISTDSIIVTFSPTTPPTVTVVDNGNSSATATATGGTAPYTFLWSNGQTSATATGLPTGSYSVVVSDAFGCTGEATVSVVSATGEIESLTSLSISPNPTSGRFFVNLALTNAQPVQLTLLDMTGKAVQQVKDTTSGTQFAFDLSQQPGGVYYLKITVGNDTLVRKVVMAR